VDAGCAQLLRILSTPLHHCCARRAVRNEGSVPSQGEWLHRAALLRALHGQLGCGAPPFLGSCLRTARLGRKCSGRRQGLLQPNHCVRYGPGALSPTMVTTGGAGARLPFDGAGRALRAWEAPRMSVMEGLVDGHPLLPLSRAVVPKTVAANQCISSAEAVRPGRPRWPPVSGHRHKNALSRCSLSGAPAGSREWKPRNWRKSCPSWCTLSTQQPAGLRFPAQCRGVARKRQMRLPGATIALVRQPVPPHCEVTGARRLIRDRVQPCLSCTELRAPGERISGCRICPATPSGCALTHG
jgi:hypothetical protein